MKMNSNECPQCELADTLCESCKHEAKIQEAAERVRRYEESVSKSEDELMALEALDKQSAEYDNARGIKSSIPRRRKKRSRKKPSERKRESPPPKKSKPKASKPPRDEKVEKPKPSPEVECSVPGCLYPSVRRGICQNCIYALGFWEKNHKDRTRCPLLLTDEQVAYFTEHFQ